MGVLKHLCADWARLKGLRWGSTKSSQHPTDCDGRGDSQFPRGEQRPSLTSATQTPLQCLTLTQRSFRDFPGGAVVKNPPTNAGDTGSSPDPGRSHLPRSN